MNPAALLLEKISHHLSGGNKHEKNDRIACRIPATGKSYLCNKILEKLHFLIVSQDDMKENYLTSMDLIDWKKK